MTQDQINNNNSGNAGSRADHSNNSAGANKRHYREFGSVGPQGSDSSERSGGPGNVRAGGNRPPRNSQRQGVGGRSGNVQGGGSGSAQRSRRSRNRRPAATRNESGQQGPVERNDRHAQETHDRRAENSARSPESATTPVQVQPAAKTAQDAVQSRNREGANRQMQRPNRQNSTSGRPARWEKKVRAEETYDDIRRDNERIEKEIWLEIASIHTIKLDL